MATSPDALTAALGPERELLPEPGAALTEDERSLAYLVAVRHLAAEFGLWRCAGGHPVAFLTGLDLARLKCDRGCGGMALVARVRRREATGGE